MVTLPLKKQLVFFELSLRLNELKGQIINTILRKGFKLEEIQVKVKNSIVSNFEAVQHQNRRVYKNCHK